ncbi:hypothetical protein M8J75_015501 [Diaphorina citri]|nr:hypothetical protein M8J75_015501 [Diaphorina citri]
MLYLEDYIELVEILPQELRDRFTEMRLLDLQSQNSLDQLQNKVNQFYQMAASMTPEQRQREYENLLQEYNKPMIDSEEKINLATQIQEFFNKYTRKLEQDIQKFKLELEADNSGITEILEKRVTDSQQKENQRSNLVAARSKMNTLRNLRSELPNATDKRSVASSALTQEYKYSNFNSGVASSAGHNAINYSLSNIGAGGMAITAAASQAIAATQQMKQGRRTASLKASYEAIHGGAGSSADIISKELAGAAQTAIAAIQDTHKKNKKKSVGGSSNLSMGTINMNTTSSALHSLMMETSSSNSKLHGSTSAAAPMEDLAAGSALGAGEEEMDTGYGPDEPRYCRCNEVAFGVMVACDSKNCPYEWYHCECVGIAPDNPPKGKWYCPLCLEKMAASKANHYGGSSRKHRKT